MLSVLFQLLFLLILLVFLGEPLRVLLFKKISYLFTNLDLIQIAIIDVFIGAMILYVLALLPLDLFSYPFLASYTLASILISFLLHRKTFANYTNKNKISNLVTTNKKNLLVYLSVILMFTIFLAINLSSLTEFIFGSVRDESIHSLYTQVIIQNHSLTSTLQPYLPEGIIYPQAASVIFAYSTLMLNLSIPEIILYVSVLFKSLSIFGAYFLGKKLGSSITYSLGLSFVTAFISSWPLNVTWGANPFLIGFPLFLVCLGLLFSLYRKNGKSSLIITGLMFGYTGAVILSYLEALIVITLLIFTYHFFVNRSSISRNLEKIAIILGMSIIPLSPFIYQFISLYNYPGHNIGLPSDISNWTSQQAYLSQAVEWAINNLSPYLIPKILIILSIGGFALLLLVTKDYEKENDNLLTISRFAIAIFASSLTLSFISFILPGDFNVISWGHQGIIISIALSILIIASYLKFAQFLKEGRFKPLAKLNSTNPTAILLIILVIVTLFTAPFLYYRLVVDPKTLQGAYDVYAITTPQDYELMQWMKANLTDNNALILVHPYSSGLFIPSISGHKIIYPYTGSAMSLSYQTLVSQLENTTINSNTYDTLRKLNITYIFISSKVVQNNLNSPKWEPTLFLGNPNFEIVKNFEDSYLFKLKGYNSNIAYSDDFEYLKWNQNDWQNNSLGWGQGSVYISANNAIDSKSLIIESQAVPLASSTQIGYDYYVTRKISVDNQSLVNLSFDLKATEGFNGYDTFALLISNTNQTQTIVIATPNSIYQTYTNTQNLNSYTGSFTYNLNELWKKAYNTTLPSTMILNIINYDFDGSCNIAQIDNIIISQH